MSAFEKIINFCVNNIDNKFKVIIRFQVLQNIYGYNEDDVCEKVYKLTRTNYYGNYYLNKIQFIDENIFYDIEIKNSDMEMIVKTYNKNYRINTEKIKRSISPRIIKNEIDDIDNTEYSNFPYIIKYGIFFAILIFTIKQFHFF
jgi:hypothetical protein